MSEPLDLDAIEARASKATAGPWNVYAGCSHDHSARTRGIGSDAIPKSECVFEDPCLASEDAEFIAHARDDIPALVARVRELTPRVIEGEWESVRDQLDALPDGAQIRWRTGFQRHLVLAIRCGRRWEMTGYNRLVISESIARDEQPIEVIG